MAAVSGWRDVVFEKLIVAVLAAATLALVNHVFWTRQEQARKRDLYFQEKVRAYSDVSGALTKYVTDMNARIELNGREPASAELAALDRAIDSNSVELALHLAHVRVYFSPAVAQMVDGCRGAMATVGRAQTTYITPDSALGRCAQELVTQLAAETRAEFVELGAP